MSNLKVLSATVVVGFSTDHISLSIEAPATFPKMGYLPFVKCEAEPGTGVAWVRTVLGLEPTVIRRRPYSMEEAL